MVYGPPGTCFGARAALAKPDRVSRAFLESVSRSQKRRDGNVVGVLDAGRGQTVIVPLVAEYIEGNQRNPDEVRCFQKTESEQEKTDTIR